MNGFQVQGVPAENTGPGWQAWQAQSAAPRAPSLQRSAGPRSGSAARLQGRPSAASLGAEHGGSTARIPPIMQQDAGNSGSVCHKKGLRDSDESAGAEVLEVQSKDGRTE